MVIYTQTWRANSSFGDNYGTVGSIRNHQVSKVQVLVRHLRAGLLYKPSCNFKRDSTFCPPFPHPFPRALQYGEM